LLEEPGNRNIQSHIHRFGYIVNERGGSVRRSILLALMAVLALPAVAANQITVDGLEKALVADSAAHRPGAEVAQELSGMALTERLSSARLLRLNANLTDERARQALVALADSSQFLDPPQAEIAAISTPTPGEMRRMLVSVVNYVNTTIRQLPNFIAERETTSFEDRPQEDLEGETGYTNLTYQPLAVVNRSSVPVAYRDGHEVVGEKAAQDKKSEPQLPGLVTNGVFGPILSTVLGDALKGKITWGRWELGANGAEAAFQYEVAKDKSHYAVGICCASSGSNSGANQQSGWRSYGELVAYHGEIGFDPASGAILRIMLEAEMPPNEAVSTADTMVEYGAVEIGGKSYICPLRSVSIQMAHAAQPAMGMHAVAGSKVAAKTFLNDVSFGQYRKFGSETRIVVGNSGESGSNSLGPGATDNATPSR
jgi:hypothetical protein